LATIAADAVARYHRLHGREDVVFVESRDERIDDLVVAPGGDVEAARLREPHLAALDAARGARERGGVTSVVLVGLGALRVE